MAKLKDNYKIIRLCRDLKIKKKKDPVTSIREYCVDKIEQIIADYNSEINLKNLLDIVASFLGIEFKEIHTDAAIKEISEEYLSKKEIKFADLEDEFTDETDAVLIERRNAKEWEKKFIAVIDCRGLKKYKEYFSKWHEIAHVLCMPPQRNLPIYYRTTIQKKEPQEKLMDIVASDFAFYSPLFLPELNAKLKIHKKLSFELIDELRSEVCPSASRHATIYAAVSKAKIPAIFLVAKLGLKKDEERQLESSQLSLIKSEPIVEKLRVKEVHVNSVAKKEGLLVHKNMEIPANSIISKIHLNGQKGDSVHAKENLNWWKHSKGKLSDCRIKVEALKSGESVLVLIQPI
jgi:hypothetical protein